MTSPKVIIGIDEAGRGALAGPLVVAAVAYPSTAAPTQVVYKGVRKDKLLIANDSKSFKDEDHRRVLSEAVRAEALAYAVIIRSAQEIDAQLITYVTPEAIKAATQQVLAAVKVDPSDCILLVDGLLGLDPTGFPCRVHQIAQGDQKVWQIGAASVVAKSARDTMMVSYATQYPDYNFDKHKGYPVPAHAERLRALGATPIHRQSYAPVRALRPPAEGLDD